MPQSPQSPRKNLIPVPDRNSSESTPSLTPPSSLPNVSPLLTLGSTNPEIDKSLSDKEREKLLYPGRVMLTSECSCLIFGALTSTTAQRLTATNSISRSIRYQTFPSYMGSIGPGCSRSDYLFAFAILHQATQCPRCTLRFIFDLSCSCDCNGYLITFTQA